MYRRPSACTRLFRAACAFLVLAVLPAAPSDAAAQNRRDPVPSIAERTAGMERLDGFIPLWWDDTEGKLWLEIGRWDEDILHYTSLPAGFGQNDLGLNRGDLGGSRVVRFERRGPKVFMVEANLGYRAITDDALERRAVDDGFPQAIHWGWTVAAETDDRVLVDATAFFLEDWHGVIRSLRQSNQGTFRLDASRSAPYRPRTKAFPTNTEVEVTLTFTSDQPGGLVRSVAADGSAVTVRQHHSFVQLPELGSYTPREFDPRGGYGGVSWYDFATPIQEPLVKRYIRRHKLEKQDPSAAVSDPVEPIVYYLDPGTPEPVRTALLEGGAWWADAFEAAGFSNAFRMEMLPPDADPMDARYNVVQWVHRSTRGWSYGNSIVDPRTGEILKGHVTLGSLRVRQDYLIGKGLTAPYLEGDEDPEDILGMSLLRIRQLSAHEIGHTIGLSHNYVASAERDAGPMSVMDYPHPRITLSDDGEIDVTEAYETGIGEWDKVAITWGYAQFPEGVDEKAELDRVLLDASARGVTFVTDQDARSPNSAHPTTHLWDNGADATAELERMMDVRRVALERFDERVLRTGEPLAMMEDILVPLFLHHRYQMEATTKVVGGLHYTYALRGDGQEPLRRVPPAAQQRALDALMRVLDPAELTIPERVLGMIPPRPPGMSGGNELFAKWTSPAFDAVSPAAAVTDATLGLLLDADRAARLIEQPLFDASLPGLDDVFARLREVLFGAVPATGYEAEIQRTTQSQYVQHLMRLAATAPMPQVRALATNELGGLQDALEDDEGSGGGLSAADAAMRFYLADAIDRFFDRDIEPVRAPSSPGLPPGSPIGMPGFTWLEPFEGGVWEVPAAPLSCSWR